MCLEGDATVVHRLPGVPLGQRYEEPPDGVIVAWRGWNLLSSVQLISANANRTWWPDIPMDSHEPIKAVQGRVGVYGIKDAKDVHRVLGLDAYQRAFVFGQVMLWGDVAEHVNGYRGQYGYPLRLWTNDFPATTKLRDAYHVPVEVRPARDLVH